MKPHLQLTFALIFAFTAAYTQLPDENFMVPDSLILNQKLHMHGRYITQIEYNDKNYYFNKAGKVDRYTYADKKSSVNIDSVVAYDSLYLLKGWNVAYTSEQLKQKTECNCNNYNNLQVCDIKIINLNNLQFSTQQIVSVARKNYTARRVSKKSGEVVVDSTVFDNNSLTLINYHFTNNIKDTIRNYLKLTSTVTTKYNTKLNIKEEHNKNYYVTYEYDTLQQLQSKNYYYYNYDSVKHIYVNPALKFKVTYVYESNKITESVFFQAPGTHQPELWYVTTLSMRKSLDTLVTKINYARRFYRLSTEINSENAAPARVELPANSVKMKMRISYKIG